MVENKPRRIFFATLIHTIWPTGHNLCRGQLFAPKLKIWPDPVIVRPKPKPMNKSLREIGLDPFVQAHRRSLGVVMNFLNYFEVK